MKDYGIVHSTEKPPEIQVTTTNVFIASNITSYSNTYDGHIEKGYEYHYVKYDKDEYIQLMAQENKNLEEQVLTTQEAICELYEMLLEGE